MLRGIRGFLLASTCASAVIPMAATAAPSTELEEIVVTASRREARLQDVPLSVSAYNGKNLDKKGIKDIADLSRITPGVTFTPTNSGVSRIAIRGIASRIGSGTTGVYIDDTPVQVRALGAGFRSTNGYPAIFDLERIEVLRGPQGTLFGAGSEGGTIRFLTPQPGLDSYSAYVRTELSFTEGGDPSHDVGMAVGGPIIKDKVGFRLSASHRRAGGYVDRVDLLSGALVDKNADSADTTVLRGALKFAVTDKFTVTPSVYYQRSDVNDTNETFRHISDLDSGRRYNGEPVRQPVVDRFTLYAVAAQYDLGFANLISNTSYFDRQNPSTADYTQVVPELLGKDWRTGYVTRSPTPTYFHIGQKTFTQEIRLQSQGDHRLNWVIGGFYQENRQTAEQFVQTLNADALMIALFGAPVVGVFGSPEVTSGGFDQLMYYGYDKSRDEQSALFGQVDYKLTDALTVTAGLRLAKTKLDASNNQGGPFVGGPSSASSHQSEKPVTPKVGVNYKPSEDLMLYASAAKGFRTGGGNNPVAANLCAAGLAALGLTAAPVDYNSDKTWSYEAGAKGSVANQRVMFDASAFYVDWKDIQSSVQLGCGLQFVGNLGTAVSKGFEAHVVASPAEGLTLEASVGYTDAKFSKTLSTGTGGVILAAKDEHLLVSPWTVALAADYEAPLPMGTDLTGYVHAGYNYAKGFKLSQPGTFGFDPKVPRTDDTHIANVRAGVRKGDIDVSLFVDNLFDSSDRTSIFHNTVPSGLFLERVLRPRTIGVTGSFRY